MHLLFQQNLDICYFLFFLRHIRQDLAQLQFLHDYNLCWANLFIPVLITFMFYEDYIYRDVGQ